MVGHRNGKNVYKKRKIFCLCRPVTVLTELPWLYRSKEVCVGTGNNLKKRKRKMPIMQNICVATNRNRTGNCREIRTGERSNYLRYGSYK